MPTIRIALVLAAALAACGREEDPKAMFATGTVCPPGGTALRYADFDLELFGDAAGTTGYCNYCHHSSRTTNEARHGAPPHADLDLIAVVREHAQLIDALAGKGPTPTTPQMPLLLPAPLPADVPDPQPVPTDEERRRLSEWLACGAPE
jgi:hypothetical protein